MTDDHVQFRECQNPACRTRYPTLGPGPLDTRCPRCLGATRAVIDANLRAAAPPSTVATRGHGQANPLEAMLDNVRSGLNVGSIFRSAEGIGLQHLYLAGITPTPESKRVMKTSLGAETAIAWSQHNNGVDLAIKLKEAGHPIWVLENGSGAVPIKSSHARRARGSAPVLVVGNEIAGVDPGILEIADRLLCVPMVGTKGSFNVAVAFALAAYLLAKATTPT